LRQRSQKLLVYYITEKITNTRVLTCPAVQITNKMSLSPTITVELLLFFSIAFRIGEENLLDEMSSSYKSSEPTKTRS